MQDLEALAPNLQLVDEIWEKWRHDPSSVDPSWRALFEPAPAAGGEPEVERPVSPERRAPVSERVEAAARTPAPLLTWDLGESLLVAAVHQLLAAYRTVGHLAADLDPLGIRKVEAPAELDPARYGLLESDLGRLVPIPALWGGGEGRAELGWILDHLRTTYARSIGAELMHISSPLKRAWLCERLEGSSPPWIDPAQARLILEQIASAQSFERFLHAKYVGTKRFSLEGCETLVPLVDMILENAGAAGVVEVVIGMAHRGRLNLLVHTMGKRPSEMFSEFEDMKPEATLGAGDVKYHLGYSKDHVTRRGHRMHLSLAHNPSHLEAVDPVVVGRVRAKQRRLRDRERKRAMSEANRERAEADSLGRSERGVRGGPGGPPGDAMGLVIHGDAAFAGQGLVAETLNLSELHGYRTGGTLHVIINNQIGFTTPPEESRSTRYCTDVAKMLECPIFHVNGEDLGAVAHVVEVAMAYRQTFGNDVVIDLFCYRKYGHNEADEPAFTQPLLYRAIERKRSVHDLWAERLIGEGLVTQEEVDGSLARVAQWLEGEWEVGRAADQRPEVSTLQGVWEGYAGGPASQARALDVDTAVARARLGEIAAGATSLPAGFRPHRKVARLLGLRAAMGRGERPVDWAMAELLAFGSLVCDGTFVRLSGQDSARGTFSQRHAIVSDTETGEEYCPLDHLRPGQAPFRVYDSPLSEAAVLAFELGYSFDYPDALIAWEAQFGDFANGAQVIIDQFLSASEEKWKRLSGLTLLLPHAFEGQGPEHSSARLERFLQLAADDNLQICFPTTPAQFFHLLRRQVVRPWRKPLVVLTPKGLLRLPAATSRLEELASGRFQRVLADPEAPQDARRVLVCAGKLYYELADERRKRGDLATAIVRVEELYPWWPEPLVEAVGAHRGAQEVVWVQEEPANMGARSWIEPRLRACLDVPARSVSRPEAASVATGSTRAHVIEQRALLEEAFR